MFIYSWSSGSVSCWRSSGTFPGSCMLCMLSSRRRWTKKNEVQFLKQVWEQNCNAKDFHRRCGVSRILSCGVLLMVVTEVIPRRVLRFSSGQVLWILVRSDVHRSVCSCVVINSILQSFMREFCEGLFLFLSTPFIFVCLFLETINRSRAHTRYCCIRMYAGV